MSKWQLPTQKGTELFPETTQHPTKVRFEGVPAGSREAHDLLQQHEPAINHFHRSQAQKYSLSTVQNYRAHAVYPGLRMTYTNLQGQEILDIKVETSLQEVEKGGEPWDWAVIDFRIPAFNHTYKDNSTDSSFALLYAKFHAPPPKIRDAAVFAPSAEWGATRDLVAPECSAETPPLLQWGFSVGEPQVGAQIETTDQTQVCSLLVDLRGFHTYEEIVVDIYGNMSGMADDVSDETIVGKSFDAIMHLSNDFTDPGNELRIKGTSHTGAEILAAYPSLNSILIPGSISTGWPNGDFVFTEANMLDQSAVRSLFAGSLTERYGTAFGGYWEGNWLPDGYMWQASELFVPAILGQTTPLVEDSSFGNGLIWWQFGKWTWHDNPVEYDAPIPEFPPGPDNVRYGIDLVRTVFIFMPVHGTTPVPVIPSSTIEIRAATFRGTPPWAWSQHHIGTDFEELTYAQWEISTQYPDRFKLGLIKKDVPISGPPGDSSGPNHGLTLLGALHIYPKHGGVTFKAAP